MAFDYSTLKRGDSVEVSTMPDLSNPVAGVVTDVRPNGAFIKVLNSPFPPLEHCWHIDDDRLKNGYEQFNYNQDLLSGEDQPYGPRTGVFKKSRNQALIESLPEWKAAVDRMLAAFEVRLRKLEAGPRDPAKPRRGRPPKNRDPEPVGAEL